jgi:hypothetical protein
MGHGNPTLWAHERLFVLSRDIGKLEATARLPLFLAFTCDWAYWDDPGSQSFPEQLLADPTGGAIGAIASTRLTYSPPNATLSRNYYNNQFSGDNLTVGEALWHAKYQAFSGTSFTYHLLGDPTLVLAAPKRRGKFLSLTPFPLDPLGRASTTGMVVIGTGDVRDTGFNGSMIFGLLDTSIPRQYTIPIDPPITLNYTLPGATAYRGFLSVTNGLFSGNFMVPRDVTPGGTEGRAFGYFYDEIEDGIASLDTVRYSTRAAAGSDATPPTVELFFDHRAYREGDVVSRNPLVILDLADSSGLNLTEAMGHGIWLALDNERPVNLTGSFRYDLDSPTEGSLEQRIGPLEPGRHSVKVEAWDSFNNLTIQRSEIEVVASSGSLVIDRVLNWPNPFHETTDLTFTIDRPADYTIELFTVNGRSIRHFSGRAAVAGLIRGAVWDGRDSEGVRVGNGVYLFKVVAVDDEGGKADKLGRIAFIR